jgi:hypothetical protein
MKVGFTGTRNGLTEDQKICVEYIFYRLGKAGMSEFHQGNCTGADFQANKIVKENHSRTCKRIAHPSIKLDHQAPCFVDETRPPKDYIDRNHDIVDETDVLIACPRTDKEELRSGTWATIRYAKKKNKRVCIIWPDGNIENTK